MSKEIKEDKEFNKLVVLLRKARKVVPYNHRVGYILINACWGEDIFYMEDKMIANRLSAYIKLRQKGC